MSYRGLFGLYPCRRTISMGAAVQENIDKRTAAPESQTEKCGRDAAYSAGKVSICLAPVFRVSGAKSAMLTADITIIGAGIVGLATAFELSRRDPTLNILVL